MWWRSTYAAAQRPGRARWALLGVAIPFGCLPAAIVVLVVGLFVALMFAQAADDAIGCGSVDPTDPSNYSTVVILNDTAAAVTLDQCRGDYCNPDQDPTRLAPGRRVQVNAACASSGADMTSWRVTGPTGLLGYVAVDTPRKHDGLVYPVSRASGSRSTATPPMGAR